MRSAQVGFLLFLLSLTAPAWSRQAQVPSVPPATKDAQALAVVSQSLVAAGGSSIVTAITDYTATGDVTYYMDVDRNVQGNVTLRGKGLNQFRLDANLPSGMRSEAIDGWTTIKAKDGSVHKLHTQSPLAPARLILPYLQLSAALNSRGLSLSYVGLVDVDGQPLHHIQVQRVVPGAPDRYKAISEYLTVNYFVDPSTFQIVMIQDVAPEHRVRQVRYSDFRPVNGLVVPFSISERLGGQDTWIIHLSKITLNSGLQDSDFEL
jgi:hypothetical protein